MKPSTFFITGGGRGIGLELARQALQNGHRVWVSARSPGKSDELRVLREKFPDHLRVVTGDVTVDDAVVGWAKEFGSGPLDVLINNAGVLVDYGKNLAELELEGVEQAFAINAVAPMRVTRAFLPALEKSASPRIVNLTSLMGSIGDNQSGGAYAYRMSKAALNMFNRSLACDFPKVTAIVIHPGWVKTDMGGADAPTTPEQSIAGILAVINRLTPADSGKFLDFRGRELPW